MLNQDLLELCDSIDCNGISCFKCPLGFREYDEHYIRLLNSIPLRGNHE